MSTPTLHSLEIPPGVFRNGTQYQSRGRWYDVNGVRWFERAMQPIGGWEVLQASGGTAITVAGVPRGMNAWRGNDGAGWLSIGTNTKLYAFSAGVKTDITPSAIVAGSADTTDPSSTATYGSGAYGLGAYGIGVPASDPIPAATWQLDTLGDYLVGVLLGDGKLYWWDRNPAHLAVVPTASSGTVPTSAKGVVVTPEKFVFVLGAGGDVRKVQWASQNDVTDWNPTTANTAGGYSLTTKGALLAGRRGRNETLLWTDDDIHAATYIGGSLIYGFKQLGSGCGLIAPNAVVVKNGVAFWMGSGDFHMYDGYVQTIPCEVSDYVFNGINRYQKQKCWAEHRAQFNEITWHYPSAVSTEVDRYVTYNYVDRHWTLGALVRTAGIDAGAFLYPLAGDASGNIYYHEKGDTRSGMTPYAESGPIDLEGGDRLVTISQIFPDERNLGDVQFSIYAQIVPLNPAKPTETGETLYGPFAIDETTDVLVTGRQVRLRLDQARATSWRFGSVRLQKTERGRR